VHVRLCHSRMMFCRAYPRETHEMVFDAHERAFAFFRGACTRAIYDNVKTAVEAIFIGKDRQPLAVIGDLPVANIGTDEVLRVLRKIWERIPETASRLRQRIEAVLDAARVKGWRAGENPARWKGHLAGELPQPRKVSECSTGPPLLGRT
jgi:hypothetical protein